MLAPAAPPGPLSSRSPRNLIANLLLHPNHGRNTNPLSMIGLIEPPMIAVMEPLRSVPKATSDGPAN
jgi:hypothetical protein